MVFVFDLDDTISVHRNRDFVNAKPIAQTITKIRVLYGEGHDIVIYSSRGQNSCKGDLDLIEERNRAQIEKWLSDNGVPYDRLVFGKPLGDVYVDDKGVSLEEFLCGAYYRMDGNSGAKVYWAGGRVIKQCKNPRAEADWYEKARSLGMNVPAVNSVVLDRIDVEYICGTPGNKRKLSREDMFLIIGQIMFMSMQKSESEFDVGEYLKFATGRMALAGWERDFTALTGFIADKAEEIRKRSSFCHGDMSLSNMIFTDGILCLIDPSPRREFSSYLMDFAKLRFSLNGGEQLLHGGERPKEYDERLSELSEALAGSGIGKLVAAMEAVHWIRMLRYFEGKEAVIYEKAKEAEAAL